MEEEKQDHTPEEIDESLLCTDNDELTAAEHIILIEEMGCPYCGRREVK